MTVRLVVRRDLPPEDRGAVVDLLNAVADADGRHALSEHALLHVRHGDDAGGSNVLAWDRDALVGYAHLDETDGVLGASAELAVHPAHRRAGVAGQLVGSLLDIVGDGRLRLWAHGTHPGAERLAARFGFEQTRVLWQMRRSLGPAIPDAVLPAGVTVRTFVVGADEAAWTELNNAAFADHPDQGGWAVSDVEVREAEPWFDAAGFFLAERAGVLAGFHWTKVHGSRGDHAHEPIGEVYVVGVHPSERGNGLGAELTLVGLHYLRAGGLAQVMLYVDESNTAAIRLYQRLGFTRWDTDVTFSRVIAA
ncbi:MAG: mycothiol synthase [Mycobacteriales bacterium]